MKNIQCNACGSQHCAQILYGRIALTEQLKDALAAGQVVLGGCIVSPRMPQWRCLDCDHAWGTSSDKDHNPKNETTT